MTPSGGGQRHRVDHVFRPEHQIDRRRHLLVGLQLVGEDTGGAGRGGPCALRSTALHDGHVKGAHRSAGRSHGGQDGCYGQHGDDHGPGGCRGTVGPTPVEQRRQAHADGHGERHQQQRAGDSDYRRQRTTGLSERDAGQRGTAERHAPPGEFGEGDGADKAEAAPSPGWDGGGGQA